MTLWCLDRGKPATERADQVLFIDARQVFRQVDRAHRDFTDEQLEFLARSSVPVTARMSDKDEGFWLRMSNSTRALAEIEVEEYIRDHW